MEDRLYILIDEKLSSGQKMSQSCHAAAEFMLKHPGIWNNSTIIILDAPRYVIDKMISKGALGYQDIYEKDGRIVRQTRSVCMVEPYGPFVSDPDGDIDEIKLIDPADFKKYFDWGKVGDRIMGRALTLRKEM